MNARNLLNAALFAATLVLAHCATPIFPGSAGGNGGSDPGYWSDGGMQTGNNDSAVAPQADLATGAADSGGPISGDAAAADAVTDAPNDGPQSDAQVGDGLLAPDGTSSDGQDDLWWEGIPTADFADSPDGL